MNALIGTGFYSSKSDYESKLAFLAIWLRNVGERRIVMMDNSDTTPYESALRLGKILPDWVQRIHVQKNAGHVGQFLGQYRPHLLGWSMSWIVPAFMAYTEGRDFCYFEQDALAFGGWEKAILSEMEEKKLDMAFGTGSKWACCEQSIFYIKNEFITEAIWSYISIPEGDGKVLPEDKFRLMSEKNMRVGHFSFPCGRNRPLPYDAPVWYSQKFTPEELAVLSKMKLI